METNVFIQSSQLQQRICSWGKENCSNEGVPKGLIMYDYCGTAINSPRKWTDNILNSS